MKHLPLITAAFGTIFSFNPAFAATPQAEILELVQAQARGLTDRNSNEVAATYAPGVVMIDEFGLICLLLSGPISILGMGTKEEWNGKEAQAGRHHRQAT